MYSNISSAAHLYASRLEEKKKFCASASGANNVCKVGPLFPEQRTAHAARPTSLCDKAKKVWGFNRGLEGNRSLCLRFLMDKIALEKRLLFKTGNIGPLGNTARQ